MVRVCFSQYGGAGAGCAVSAVSGNKSMPELVREYSDLTCTTSGKLASMFTKEGDLKKLIARTRKVGALLGYPAKEKVEVEIDRALSVRIKRDYVKLTDSFNGLLTSAFEKDEQIEQHVVDATELGKKLHYTVPRN